MNDMFAFVVGSLIPLVTLLLGFQALVAPIDSGCGWAFSRRASIVIGAAIIIFSSLMIVPLHLQQISIPCYWNNQTRNIRWRPLECCAAGILPWIFRPFLCCFGDWEIFWEVVWGRVEWSEGRVSSRRHGLVEDDKTVAPGIRPVL